MRNIFISDEELIAQNEIVPFRFCEMNTKIYVIWSSGKSWIFGDPEFKKFNINPGHDNKNPDPVSCLAIYNNPRDPGLLKVTFCSTGSNN